MTTATDDLDGEVISTNGSPVDTPNGEAEDRGDVVQLEDAPEAKPEAKAPAAEESEDRKLATIPKPRFDEVNERRKQVERELEEANRELERLRQPAAKPAVQDASSSTDDKEQAYIDAMMDGDADKAKAIRREINADLLAEAETRFESRNQAKQTANLAQAEATAAVENYPYLDTEEGAVALALIIDARDAKIARGVPAHQALREAVETIAPKFAPDTPTGALQGKAPIVDTRSQDALKRGAADSQKQPPSVQAGIGNRANPINPDVLKLDEDQFAALSKAEKSRMRGD